MISEIVREMLDMVERHPTGGFKEEYFMALPVLRTFGLSSAEAEVYELLLQLGEVSIAPLLQKAGLKRPTLYLVLQQLEKKGLITSRDVDKKLHFRAEPPDRLLSLAENQYQTLDRAKKDLQTLIPLLTSQYIMSVEKPVVRTFEGVKGLQEIYEDTLREGKPIYAVLQTAEVQADMYSWLTTTYVKKRAKAGISAKVIVSSGKWAEEYEEKDEKELRTTRLVPHELFPFTHEVNVYGDKVAFMNYKKGEALIGIIIHHPQIAQTMKAWFDLAWIGAKEYQQ